MIKLSSQSFLKNSLQTVVLLGTIIFLNFGAEAKEVINVCATYKNSGKSYSVEAHVYDGSEFSRAINSLNPLEYLGSTFAVIFWSNENATVIEIESSFVNIGGLAPVEGNDQRGYPWLLEPKFSSRCLFSSHSNNIFN